MISSLLSQYESDYPEDATLVARFYAFLKAHVNPFSRECLEGHFTASAIILNNDRSSVVLLHHRKLNSWMQPGGHADGDEDLLRVAGKEALEETGLDNLELIQPNLIGLSIHEIPARNEVPKHLHYDFRFAFRAPGERLVQNDESLAVKWFAIAGLQTEPELMTHILRAQRALGNS